MVGGAPEARVRKRQIERNGDILGGTTNAMVIYCSNADREQYSGTAHKSAACEGFDAFRLPAKIRKPSTNRVKLQL